MFSKFFFTLREANIPVTLKEYLTLLEAMKKGISGYEIKNFYYLSRACLVKDEKNLDRFDKVFGICFNGSESDEDLFQAEIPDEWLRKVAERLMTPEEMAEVEKLGGWEKLMETLKERLKEQKKQHSGGNKMIGTGGTSPFGAFGYNPEGIRMGQNESRQGRAVKVWDQRKYKNLDDRREIGTRNMKIALRRLRQFAREGAQSELDMKSTINSTARNGGWLDLQMVPERRNNVKVLLLLDIGGSMDFHIENCEQLFSAASSEFKNLEYFYFHNCPYETLWKDNRRRKTETISTWDLLNTYSSDYKVIFVGDATMGPYEITYPGGSVEHWNDEPGELWMTRLLDVYNRAAWLNPVNEEYWRRTPSIHLMRKILGDRMFPLTLEGLDRAMHALSR